MINLPLYFVVFSGLTSPANAKLGLRMTTLHEEQLPLARKHSLDLIADECAEDEKDESSAAQEGKSIYSVFKSTDLVCISLLFV